VRGALVLLIVAPIAFALLAGCASCVEGPPVSARNIADTDDTAGVLGYELNVRITEGPGGLGLPGAGVVVYYGGTTSSEWRGPRVEVRPDLVLVEPMNATGTVESKTVLRMMSDGTGLVHARVPGQRILGVVAAKDGYTEEWVPALAAGETGESGTITLPLYRANLTVDMDAVWGPGGASTGAVTNSQYAWDTHEVPFGSTEGAARGYAARIVEMRVTIDWTNGATGVGDLGIGAGPPEDGPRYFSDGRTNAATGAQQETTMLDVQTLREHGILGAPSIDVGAASETGFVAPFGLPYTIHVEALFDTARAALSACSFGARQDDNEGFGASVPGGATLVAVLGLAGAALVVARKH
jgi:hypothetical protein